MSGICKRTKINNEQTTKQKGNNKMNSKKTSKFAIRRAKETLLGRILCRLAGEESGQAMMEYVIIAVMIAAAVVVGAWFFGKDILNMFGVAGQAATGNPQGAAAMQQQAVNAAKAGHDEATKRNQDFIQTDNEGTGTITPAESTLKAQ